MDTLARYFNKWCLKNSADKSELITFNNRRQLHKSRLTYEDKQIQPNKDVEYFGVILDKRLNFNKHVDKIHKHIRAVAFHIWPYIEPENPMDEKIIIRLIQHT